MLRTLEIPFPPGHRNPLGGRLEPPYVPVEPRWEYREITRDVSSLPGEAELNGMGEDGWELAGVVPAGSEVHFYFKRERRR